MLLRLESLMSDPMSFLISFLLMLPGAALAISIHESAHGWVAEKCGDPTARYEGRITLNPIKHFDPIGFLAMLFVGFGWAKPVPVNPLLYKNYRRDDIKVSLAGITANLCLFFVCFILTQAIFMLAVGRLDTLNAAESYRLAFSENGADAIFKTEDVVFSKGYIWEAEELFRDSAGLYYYSIGGKVVNTVDIIITPSLGRVVGIIYQMLINCMLMNLSLAVFNLIPLPPLDGYHVLNDLVLKQDLFAQRRTQQISMAILLALIVIGNAKPEWDVISIAINGVRKGVTGGLTSLTRMLALAIGVM